ncbi:hypothetical protein MMPV_006938 [Pyropia vietnamensis]
MEFRRQSQSAAAFIAASPATLLSARAAPWAAGATSIHGPSGAGAAAAAVAARPAAATLRMAARPPTGRRPSKEEDPSRPRAPSPAEGLARRGRQAGIAALAALLLFTSTGVDGALAARGGGRVGGSSFSSPQSAPAPSYGGGGYEGGGYGGGYGGGGVMVMPRIYTPVIPVYGGFGLGGFGGLTTLLLLVAVAGVVVSSVGSAVGAVTGAGDPDDPPTSVVTVKVGLLASARQLQRDLDAVAQRANTMSARGLAELLQEVVVALVRNPDYWTHASLNASPSSMRLSEAEAEFGRRSLNERVKLEEETLSNVGGMGVRSTTRRVRPGEELSSGPSEYIVVTLVVAATGELSKALPRRLDGVADLRAALTALGGVTTDDMQACEVIWAPQSDTDTLTEQEMLADHPDLVRV